MLHEFLLAERDTILALCAEKFAEGRGTKSSSEEMQLGLPTFYDELIEVLREDELVTAASDNNPHNSVHRDSAVRYGKESLRLGYTISQVVHGYGALCQSITEYASDQMSVPIQMREFNRLNFCLDVAIAEAVTEFSRGQRDSSVNEEVLRLGYLAHEMRNALATVAAAHRLIQTGVVGFEGSTNRVLENALTLMKDIIDRSLLEVRLRAEGESNIIRRRCRVLDMVGEVEATAAFEANAKKIQLHIEVPPRLVVDVDRHLVMSAISNLVQNAIKFTRTGGNVWIRASVSDGKVLIQIEDECGGLPAGKIEELFRPYTQKGVNRTGLGLGLSISRRSIALNSGTVTACDVPSKGCVFTIELPEAPPLPAEHAQPITVQ